MFRRQKTRNSNIVYKCSTVAFGLAFSHCLSSLQKEMGGKTFPFYEHVKRWQERREQRCWERVTGRGSYKTREALHLQDSEKTRRGF
jgi:hypothetical protein